MMFFEDTDYSILEKYFIHNQDRIVVCYKFHESNYLDSLQCYKSAGLKHLDFKQALDFVV